MRDRHACARKLNGTRLTLMEFLAIVPGVSAWDIESPVQDGESGPGRAPEPRNHCVGEPHGFRNAMEANMAKTSLKLMLVSLLLVPMPASILAKELPKEGKTSYTSHYVFRPLDSMEVPGVGKVTPLEMVGTTSNTKGDPFFDNMKAKCFAISVETGGKKWIDGACAMTDADGDVVFSSFDTRDLDKNQPDMNCGTHLITGGTGKYKGISGKEPFACIEKPAPAGAQANVFAMDIPHNTNWAIK